jgi:hypothetical protein
VFSEMLLSLDGAEALATMNGEGGVAQRGKRLGRVAGSSATGVLAVGHVAHVMQAVLNAPMRA